MKTSFVYFVLFLFAVFYLFTVRYGPEFADPGPAAGRQHLVVRAELAPRHRSSIHDLTSLKTEVS